MQGRKKIATKLKKIKGTLQPCRVLSDEIKIIPLNTIPVPPEHFNDWSKKEWKIVCEHLRKYELLAGTDMALLTSYCYAVGMCREAEKQLATQPKVASQKNKEGHVYQIMNKWTQIWLGFNKQMVSIGSEFGFSPSSRTRISAPQQIKNDRDKEMFGT